MLIGIGIIGQLFIFLYIVEVDLLNVYGLPKLYLWNKSDNSIEYTLFSITIPIHLFATNTASLTFSLIQFY